MIAFEVWTGCMVAVLLMLCRIRRLDAEAAAMRVTYDDVPYCVNGCGKPAVAERAFGVAPDGTIIVDLICELCWERHEHPTSWARL